MSIPLLQKLAVGSYVVRQHLTGRKRYPLVLMLEPLFRCNLACAGCGKIDYPDEILNQRMSVEGLPRRGRRMRRAGGLDRRRRAAAAREIAGDRARHHRAQEVRLSVHQCAAAGEEAGQYEPNPLFRLVGASRRRQGDARQLGVPGGRLRRAVAAIKAAKARGFRVNINCTLFNTADPEHTARFFDTVKALGVDGITVSPGYAYERAPDQQHFLNRDEDQAAVPRHLQARARRHELVVQPVRPVPRFPRRQPDLSLHALGQSDAHHLRLAEALLSARRRLCQDLQAS